MPYRLRKEDSMFGNTRIHIRVVQAVAAVATATALLVPAASATPFITDTLAPGGTSAHSPHFITDTLAPGGRSAPAASYRFVTDTLAPGGGASGIVSVSTGTGFSWADAGIGAVVTCGLMLLALAGHQFVGRRRRGQLAF
jgi:hypothetical protein